MQELELELTTLKQTATGTDQPDSASQEELVQLREEKAELKENVKQLEQKLIDIKDKNNVSRMLTVNLLYMYFSFYTG